MTKEAETGNFILDIIDRDVSEGNVGAVVTRFPPEPNGYLHIGHAKSICLNFGIKERYGGRCNLRFDDTNPETEDMEYVEAIKRDVRWLGFEWDDVFHASDYFEQLYDWAVVLIQKGKAYVDDQTIDQIRETRGTVTEPGRESPYRNRSVEENLDLFARMKAGAFGDGEKVLRAKIDMASPNMKMRDPLMYRIRHATHYRRGDTWCIYPMYDWAHGQSDAIEGITHSLCTLEFETNRELYDWFLDSLEIDPRPHQYEFARGNLDHAVMSKRKFLELVKGGYVAGWDDPRMPTLSGLRRRGVTPDAIRALWDRVGVARADNRVDYALLEYSIRDDLNFKAPRVMAVLDPLKVVITNYPETQEEWLDASYWPHDVPKEGSRQVPFSRELFIERDDFMEDPPRKFYRLSPGREVRLRYGYFITCNEVVRDADGRVVALHCTYDPETKGGDAPDGRKVRGTLHWVSARHALPCAVRLYDRLFTVGDPEAGEEDYKTYLNPDSCVVLKDARVEPSVAGDPVDTRYQFERQGYFWQDPQASRPDALVFNRIVPLRDSWARMTDRVATSKGDVSPKEPPAESAEDDATPQLPAERPDPTEAFTPEQHARMARYVDELALDRDDAALLADDAALAAFFEQALDAHDDAQSVANWVVNEVMREVKDTPLEALPFDGAQLGSLVALIDDGVISARIAKDVFGVMVERGGDPAAIVEAQGLRQLSDRDALQAVAATLVQRFPDKAALYREGKRGLIGFFMGQLMRETAGKADPEMARKLLEDHLQQ